MAAETRAAAAAAKTIIKTAPGRFSRVVTGVVVSAGLSDKSVKVQVGGEEWDKKLKKYFQKSKTHLVHDPNNSLRTGDAVEIVSGWRTSKRKRFVVSRIIAPYGPPVDERPPVPTQAEREALHDEKRTKKAERKELKAEAALLERKVKTAAKLTEEITRAAWKMRLINRETWTGPVPTR